jgi:hypothetical protein
MVMQLFACSAGSEDEANRVLERYERELGFEIITPEYIPPGTNPVPFVSLVEDDEINYVFPGENTSYPIAESPRIEVRQARADGLDSAQTPAWTPSGFPSNRETTVIGGQEVVLFRNAGPGGASMEMSVPSSGFDLSVTLIWASPVQGDIIAITPEMEQEAWKVLRSMTRL